MRIPAKFMTVVAAAAVLSACSPAEHDSTLPAGAEVTPSRSAGPASESLTHGHGADAHGDECTAEDFKVTGSTGREPVFTVPKDCAAPSKLLVVDLDKGTGKAIESGDSAELNYVLKAFSTGEKVDSSWDRGQPLPLENIGQAGVIDGWNEGLIGLKEGGRRLLVVPPDKGYGEQGSGEAIKPNETLVFVIGAVSVGKASS